MLGVAALHHGAHGDAVLGEHARHRSEHTGAVGHGEADIVLRLQILHRKDGQVVGTGASHDGGNAQREMARHLEHVAHDGAGRGARAGALAHYLFDPSVHADDNLAYYLVGEGVGLGVIDNGRLINGFLGAATEIGHISIDVNGRPCDCGNVGCLERYCSTPAIHDTLIADGTVVPGAADMTHTEAARALFAKAGDGDEAAIAIVREVARYVGYGCVTIFNGYNPEHIIIGDIVSEAGPILLDEVRATVAERAIPEINASTSISLSTLSADAAVSGAAAVAVTQFLEHPSVFFDVS